MLRDMKNQSSPHDTEPRNDEIVHLSETQSPNVDNTDYDDGLLSTAIPLMVGAYGCALAIAAFTFLGSGEALFVIAISAAYGAMYFGLPLVIARVRRRNDPRWTNKNDSRYSQRVQVFSGSIGRFEAILQMTIVPLAVAIAFAAFATIWLSLGA